MNALRLRSLLAAVILTAIAACVSADSSTSPPPAPAPNADLTGALLETTTETLEGTTETLTSTVNGVLSPFACRTDGYGSVTRTVGYAGGIIRIGPHSLAIPPGALYRSVTITATAPAGDGIRVDFEPEGLRFDRKPLLTLSYAECPVPPLLPRIVYVDDGLNLLEILSSVNLPWNESVSARLKHFSGYMVWE